MSTSIGSIEDMIHQHMQLAHSCVRRFYLTMPPDVSYDDLFAAALEGLWRAAKTWNPDRAKFSTYATACMRRAMIDWLRLTRRKRGHRELREQQYTKDDLDWLDPRRSTLDEIDDRDEVEGGLGMFKPPLQDLLRDHFLHGYTLKEIAEKYNMLYMTVVKKLLPFRDRAEVAYRRPQRTKL